MIRLLLRAFGFVLVAAAFAALVVDGTRSIAGGHLLQYSLGDTVAWLGGERYAAAAGSLAQSPLLVRQVVAAAFAAPGWIITGGLGLLLLHAGRQSSAQTGFSDRRA